MKPLFEQIAAMQDIIRGSEPAVKPMRSCRWCRGTERESPDGCSHCEDVVWEGDDE